MTDDEKEGKNSQRLVEVVAYSGYSHTYLHMHHISTSSRPLYNIVMYVRTGVTA